MSEPEVHRLPVAVCVLLALAALLGLSIWALVAGPFPLSLADLWHALARGTALDAAQHSVLFNLRLPRLAAAIGIGGALAVAGCSFQAVLRNPLADPGLIGVSGGAAAAAAAALALSPGLPLLPPQLLVPLAALAGGLITAALVLRLSRTDGDTAPVTLLLAGLAINALAGGVLGLIAYGSNDPTLRAITLWLFGSLDRVGWPELGIGLPVISLAALTLWRLAPALNALLLGEAAATHIGVDVPTLKRTAIVLAVVCASCAVALAGVIGFIGLMVPHLLRMLIGPDHRTLLPMSFVAGAALLLLADIVARIALQPAEIPVGILCALLGAPFFLGLLLRWRRSPLFA